MYCNTLSVYLNKKMIVSLIDWISWSEKVEYFKKIIDVYD